MNLTEVLIAMGILTLGLLGVAALFPVGSHYMAKADIANNGSALAQAVMNDLVARGMLNPSVWFVITPNPISTSPTDPNFRFLTVDGKYTPYRTPIASTFTRPFAETLRLGVQQAAISSTASPDTIVSRQFGNAYVIDPMYVAASALPSSVSNNNRIAYAFPASALITPPRAAGPYYSHAGWDPWKAANLNQLTWPIRRVTLQQSTGWQLDARMADYFFRGNDDLTADLPDRDDRPAAQNWEMMVGKDGAAAPLARQWTGDYSWIVCVVPTTAAARNGMATSPESFAYDVSVVVFYKRVLPAAPPQTTAQFGNSASYERTVGAKVISTGLTGGELLLTDLLDNSAESPFMHLKTSQWIMLCGPHPNSAQNEPRFVLNWYQVLSIDSEGVGIAGFNPVTNRVVAVRGPEWPWQPAQNLNYTDVSNDLCVGICRGAVAVHTKTLRLEGLHGAAGSGMTLFVPPNVSGPQYSVY